MPGLLLAAACGTLSALCFAYLAAETGFYLHTLSVMVVVPIGGALAGAAAGWGLAVGVQAVTAENTRRNYWTAAALGPATYLALYWWLWGLEAPGAPFWHWVGAGVADSTRFIFFGLVRPQAEATAPSAPLAALGWLRFLAQLVGAALGSFMGFHLVARDLEPCPACRKSYRSPVTLFYGPDGDGAAVIAQFRALQEGDSIAAWLAERRAAAPAAPARGEKHLAVRLVRCARAECGAARLSAGPRVSIATGNFSVGREESLELRREAARGLAS